ncbi:MAG: hypothetical protein AAFX54_12785 [Pseudomonadota bacterium]
MQVTISKAEEQGQRDRANGKTGHPPKDMTPQEQRDYQNGFNKGK